MKNYLPKNILYIAHRIPFPPNKGDKIRTFNQIRYLSQFYRIDLVTLAENENELAYEKDLKAYCRQVVIFLNNKWLKNIKGIAGLLTGRTISERYFYIKAFHKKTAALVSKNQYQAILCFSSPMAEYVLNLPRQTKPPTLIMDYCDVDSQKWDQYSTHSFFPMNLVYRTESRRLLKYEQKINKIFDTSVFVSQKEADLFKQLVPQARNVTAIKNGVDFDYFTPEKHSNDNPVIMFAGAMDYQANIDGITWFCRKVLPRVKKKHPAVQVNITGSNPSPVVRELGKIENINVTGYVDDIRTYYNTADICIVPLRIARGIQNKVLEAMAMARPLVATPSAMEGIDATVNEHYLSAFSTDEFTQSICDLIENPSRAESMGRSARKFIHQNFAWDSCLKPFQTIIEGGH